MATRHAVVPQQARGEEIVGRAKQPQKKNVVDGRNRRALGDIGNLGAVGANDGKPQPQVTRPITRSFCAQLLANAQAAAAAENKQKQVCVNVNKHDGVPAAKPKPLATKVPLAPRVAIAPKLAQRKPAVKPKPEEVIEISSDKPFAKAEVKQEKANHPPVNKKKAGEGSSKKNSATYSSVLTARSKAACGINNKPKADIVDIDAADASNDLAGVEYIDDMYTFYKSAENESRPHSYMHLQTEINEKMRSILVDWLIDVHLKFELAPETLYLTINIIDRFLSVKVVPRRELQLVGVAALLMASKYEEIWPPEVNELVCISDSAYTHQQILVMEKTILGKLEWYLTLPTHYVFLARFIKASIPDQEMENMVYFVAELGVMDYDIITQHPPSKVAASAVYVARCTLNKSPVWTDTLKHHTGYSESQLIDCAKLLVCLHSKAKESRLQAVMRKYSKVGRGAVSEIQPFKNLLLGSVSSA